MDPEESGRGQRTPRGIIRVHTRVYLRFYPSEKLFINNCFQNRLESSLSDQSSISASCKLARINQKVRYRRTFWFMPYARKNRMVIIVPVVITTTRITAGESFLAIRAVR